MNESGVCDDRRKAVRVQRKIFAQYKKGLRIAPLKWTNSAARNVSETGGCLYTGDRFVSGGYIRIRLKIPTDSHWLLLTGKIIKSNREKDRFLTHIRFLDLDKELKEKIRTYIAWVMVKEGGIHGISGNRKA